MSKSIKIPDQHYCGMQKRGGDDLPLGFITPYGTDQAARNRMDTVDKWAKGYRSETELPSKILNNTPMTGFKLSDTIKRYSSWGRGNVVWRIDDPRGFELEITNNNLMQIMMCAIIMNGEIMSPCVWGREGPENVLIPTESRLYKDAKENTARQKRSVSIKDLKIGNTVVLQNGLKGKYLGSFFELTFSDWTSSDRPEVKANISKKKKHFILSNKEEKSYRGATKNIHCIASLKVADIADDSTDSVEDSLAIINSATDDTQYDVVDGHQSTIHDFRGATTGNAEITITLTQIDDIQQFASTYSDYYTSKKVVGEYDDDYLVYTSTRAIASINGPTHSRTNHCSKIRKRKLLENNTISKIYSLSRRQSSIYWSRDYHEESTVELEHMFGVYRNKSWYALEFTFTDEETGIQYSLPM